MVFLNLPETREERVRRDEREKIRREEGQRRMEELDMIRRESEQIRMELRARAAAWYARMQEAQAKGERFDEPPTWEE